MDLHGRCAAAVTIICIPCGGANEFSPTVSAGRRTGTPDAHEVLTPAKIGPLFGSCYTCDRVNGYRYIGTAYHPNFFVPGYPYEARPLYSLGGGGLHRAPVSGSYPVFNHALQLPHHVEYTSDPASYSNLPTGQGWHPGEANFDINDDEYITCVREIRYHKFSTMDSLAWIYLKSWDWFQRI